jgi:hypothetical protein
MSWDSKNEFDRIDRTESKDEMQNAELRIQNSEFRISTINA